MSAEALLFGGLTASAERAPDALAVSLGEQALGYGALEQASRTLALELGSRGLRPGDRVGLALPKSLDAVVAVYGVLRAGGVYVPLDEQSPPGRKRDLLGDCGVRGVIGDRRSLDALAEVDRAFVGELDFVLGRDPPRFGQREISWDFGVHALGGELPPLDPAQPAYILYTSGSTGRPKGVTVSHRGARAFVDWAVRAFGLHEGDRLTSHAQLNFDLSILDLFAASAAGASVTLIPPEMLLRPSLLWELVDRARITTWYSVPSALTLLMSEAERGAPPPRSLARVLFAGEVFPIPQLRRMMAAWPKPSFFNLFGPTETNVCLWHALRGMPAADASAIPIGLPCDHLTVELLDEQGCPVLGDQEGEIAVGGPTVLSGYWGRPELTEQAFWPESTLPGRGRLYRTGDRARRDGEGRFWFLGRRDRLVKRRGYRIELGEVEAILARHPGVREVAVVADPDAEAGCRVRAVVVRKTEAELDEFDIKVYAGAHLPRYMLPDKVEFLDQLPRTGTGKIDWQDLQ